MLEPAVTQAGRLGLGLGLACFLGNPCFGHSEGVERNPGSPGNQEGFRCPPPLKKEKEKQAGRTRFITQPGQEFPWLPCGAWSRREWSRPRGWARASSAKGTKHKNRVVRTPHISFPGRLACNPKAHRLVGKPANPRAIMWACLLLTALLSLVLPLLDCYCYFCCHCRRYEVASLHDC